MTGSGQAGGRRGIGGPQGWVAVAALGVFVAGSAAFGGLADRQADVPALAAGVAVRADMLELTVLRAGVVDELPEQYVSAGDGERLLVVRAEVVNRWNEAISPGGDDDVNGDQIVGENAMIRIADVATNLPTVLSADGEFATPVFQPDLPTTVDFVWRIPADALRGGDQATIELRDGHVTGGQAILSANYRYTVVEDLAALITVDVVDDGTGAS